MKLVEIVFSPTGGTMQAADMVAKAFDEGAKQIDLCNPKYGGCRLEEDNIAIIAMPSFGGRAPALAIERLAKIKANGNKCAVIAVYGNRAQEDALLEITDAAEACGFQVIAAAEAIAEHSIAREYAAGRPDDDDRINLLVFGERFLKKIKAGNDAKPDIPGNRPYQERGKSSPVPCVLESCIECGVCAQKCPSAAIDMFNPRKTDTEKCISCMRCISVCRSSSRVLPEAVTVAVTQALKPVCSTRKECIFYL